MANTQRNFIAGIMNKSLDERLLPNGQYVDALNVRLGSTEETEVGSVENTKGNVELTSLEYDGQVLSPDAKCIGAYEDGGNETIYWFVHDSAFGTSPTNKLDLIISLNVQTNTLTYHVISISNPLGTATTLNFNPAYLITGVNLVDNELLFFTDNINPPRFINVKRNYPNPVGNLDGFTAESILVIKKPPITSPSLALYPPQGQNNFLEDRFICFAYRYQYADGEFSAPSQFSEAAFIAKPFAYDFGVGLNDGMLNSINTADITYNSGGPLVVAVELLWKDMQNGTIKAIEKLNKSQLNIADNTEYTYRFEDSKIFTILPSSEILRLYDNVPRLAQAQTLMGNRLVYGNYLEQYDLVTPAGGPVQLTYTTSLNSRTVGLEVLDANSASQTYTVENITTTIINGAAIFNDIGTFNLVRGASIEFEISYEHASFVGPNPPNVTNGANTLSFVYNLPRDYTSAHDLATSQEFIDRIGTITNIQTVANACSGSTMTDVFNCSLVTTLGALSKYQSGVTAFDQPIQILSAPGQDYIGFSLLAMGYVDVPPPNTTQAAVEYYQIQSVNGTFQSVGDTKSLHSNRNYEIGIIYMDDFNRATTALVSQYNTVFVPCENSQDQNRIEVNIPITQIAPSWATRYKFCIKQDKEDYFNVYSSFFVLDPTTSATYFLLEGQNAQKIQEGDILQVKSDSNGPMTRCAFATVLEKKSQLENFLTPPPTIPGGNNPIPVPTGVYMKMRATDFSASFTENAVINYGEKSSSGSGCRQVSYPTTDGSGAVYTVPAGSKIRMKIDNFRRGNEDTTFGNVPKKKWFVDAEFTSSSDYNSLKDWFEGDNIEAALSAQAVTDGTGVSGPNYDPAGNLQPCSTGSISCVFTGGANNDETFRVKSSEGYSGNKKKVTLKVLIEVIRATSFVAWETKPTDAVPDVWYISPDSYPLAPAGTCEFELSVDSAEPNAIEFDYTDVYGNPATVVVDDGKSATVIGLCGTMATSPSTPPANPANITIDSFPLPEGAHIGNLQTQFGGVGGTDEGIIETSFFNCFSFGNGIESYQILDEIAGKELTLGNQVTSTSAQEYKEVLRFADLTYSGVFNDESNVNKLNEFNLGLLNFKPLEEEFGNVMKLDGRETDILCLQEDKISYVLAGKNLLSDATGGGAVTSVPEVLGTQIARIEEYGISFNPESYAKWGSNKFFTDAKRGAVLQLKGTSAQNEQLIAISEAGMRSWFRDLFIENFNTQKLGGYDPYMNEYVLSSNEELLPEVIECIDCGITRTVGIAAGNPVNFCVDVGTTVGAVTVTYNVLNGSGDDFELEATFNGNTSTSGPTAVSGNVAVSKNVITPEKVNVFIDMVNAGSVDLEVTVECPDANSISIIQVCISKDENAGEFIHNEYYWSDGVVTSPTTSVGVQLAAGNTNPLISQYTLVTGLQGAIAPTNGAIVRIISNRIGADNFIFDPAVDNFRWLRTPNLYANTPANISNLLAASNNANPITGGGGLYGANFVMPNTADQYLYLIYDYRNAEEVELCYDANTSFAACCECGAFTQNYEVRQCRADALNVTYVVSLAFGLQIGQFCELVGFGDCVFELIGTTTDPISATIAAARLDVSDCTDLCYTYGVANNLAQAATMNYVDCNGVNASVTVSPGNTTTVCLKSILSLTANLTITLSECDCDGGGGELRLYEVTQCREDGVVNTEVIQDQANSLNIGSYIEISNYPNCVFEVTGTSAGPATESVVSILGIRGCSSVCQTYSLSNVQGFSLSLNYVDCDNQAANVVVAANSSVTICAQQIVTLNSGLLIQLNNCLCNTPQ